MPLDEDGINRYEEPAEADKSWDTSDVQWNNINDKDINNSTKSVISVWISRIWKTFANSRPHKTGRKTKLSK